MKKKCDCGDTPSARLSDVQYGGLYQTLRAEAICTTVNKCSCRLPILSARRLCEWQQLFARRRKFIT